MAVRSPRPSTTCSSTSALARLTGPPSAPRGGRAARPPPPLPPPPHDPRPLHHVPELLEGDPAGRLVQPAVRVHHQLLRRAHLQGSPQAGRHLLRRLPVEGPLVHPAERHFAG